MFTFKACKRLMGASALAILCGVVAAQAQSQTAPPSTAGAAATGAGSVTTTKLSKRDQGLLMDMAQANLAEIEAGKIAQGKAQNAEVKSFAQKMVDDHSKALAEVQQVAQAKGVTLPTEADAKHKKMAQRLSALSGADFDRRYMAQNGVDDHKKTHQLLQRVTARATDPDIKALAAKMLPTVDQHLNSVQQLTASMKGQTSSGSSGSSGTSSDTSSGGSNNGSGNVNASGNPESTTPGSSETTPAGTTEKK